MTEENKPAQPSATSEGVVHTGEGSADSSNFQPTIDTNQAGASAAYGEDSIQILEGLEAVRKRPPPSTDSPGPTAPATGY